MSDLLALIGFFVIFWLASYMIILACCTIMGTIGVVIGPLIVVGLAIAAVPKKP